jgi:fatty acid desaturase
VALGIGEEVNWMREINVENARADFTAHAALYLLVMTALIALNFSFVTGFWWSVIPLVGWGVVLALVGWGVVLALHYLYLRRIERADADRRARNGQRATTAKPTA